MVYNRTEEKRTGPLTPGLVYVFGQSGKNAVFKCPCGKREICLTDHTISFDADGLLTVEPSIGSSDWATKNFGKCHLQITAGKARKYADTECPAKTMQEIEKTK